MNYFLIKGGVKVNCGYQTKGQALKAQRDKYPDAILFQQVAGKRKGRELVPCK